MIRIHALAGTAAIMQIIGFQAATLGALAFGSAADSVAVKRAILWLIPLLVGCMAATGASGTLLARRRPGAPVEAKRRRMALAAALGLLLLVPCAVALDRLARQGEFGGWYVALQAAELAAGLVNLTLLVANARAGRAMKGGRGVGSATAPG